MTDTDDFFDQKPDGPQRDRWGRPLLFPAALGPVDNLEDSQREPYTRASSLSDYLADFSHIQKWKMRYLARSLGQNRMLAGLAGAESYTTGFDKGDEAANRASGRRLDEIIERALDWAGISEKADYGTIVHAETEPESDRLVEDERVRADVASWWACLKEYGIVLLGTEMFTANDLLRVSGTFDNLAYVPRYGICVVDKKTSSKVHGGDFRIQLATYSNGDIYDWETDKRTTLEEYVESIGWDPALINRNDGFIFWIKDGKTTVHRLDLAAGLEAAKHAVWVRDHHRKGTHQWIQKSVPQDPLVAKGEILSALARASSRKALEANFYAAQHLWDDDMTAAAKAREEEINRG